MSESGAGEPETATRVEITSAAPPSEAAPQAESKPPEPSNGDLAPPAKPPAPKIASPTKAKPTTSTSSTTVAKPTSSSSSSSSTTSVVTKPAASSASTSTPTSTILATTVTTTTITITSISKPTTPAKPAPPKPTTTTPANGTAKSTTTAPKTTTTTSTTKPAGPTKPPPAKPTGTPAAKPTTTTTTAAATTTATTSAPKATTTTTNTPKAATTSTTKPATPNTTATSTTKTATTTPAAKPTAVKKEGETNGVKKEGETPARKEETKAPAVKKEPGSDRKDDNKETADKKEPPKKRKKDDESDDDDDDDSSDTDSSDEGDSSGSESDTPLEDKAASKPKSSVASNASSNNNNSSNKSAQQPPAKRQATANAAKPTPQSKPVTKKVTPAAKLPPKKKAKAPESDSDSSTTDSSDSSDSDDSSDSSDTDDNESKKPAKRKQEKKSSRGDSAASSAKVNPMKNYEIRAENVALKAELGANKWWNRLAKKHVKWQHLIHNGPRFPPAYVPHGVPLLYDNAKVPLSPTTEEVATFYASMLETDFMNKPVFKKNFFRDWQAVMTSEERKKIASLDKCNFKPIHVFIMADRENKKELKKLPENKLKTKEEQAQLTEIYGFARVDGYLEKVGNYRVEPPSLFRGRGDHPKTGMLKRRVQPEDVVINIGKGVPIPRPPEGHNWKGVVHNNKVTWLAFWQDNINKDFKYVYLSATSRFKGESDIAKYGKAQTLIQHIGTIRKKYNTEMTDKDRKKQQLAVALYALDVLALRVGNEKDTDNRADTVGLCSLRVEHITFPCPEERKVRLNFLGKDSMVYDNTVEVPPAVYENLVKFAAGKAPKANLFDKLDPGILNDHLKEIMPGLSAKVFRTYNASVTLEQELEAGDISIDSTESEKIHFYNKANTTVAILCNHQRSVPKAHAGQMEKIEESLGVLQKELKDLMKDKKNNRTKIANLEQKIEKKELQKTLKSTTATVALGTSKINYMDPRVTVAWCKKVDLPLEKVFNPALVMKFPWAMEVPSSWKFDPAKNPKPKLEKQKKEEEDDD